MDTRGRLPFDDLFAQFDQWFVQPAIVSVDIMARARNAHEAGNTRCVIGHERAVQHANEAQQMQQPLAPLAQQIGLHRAATTQFGARIAHGMLSGAFISATIAGDLPGPGSIYLSQTMSFRRPVKW